MQQYASLWLAKFLPKIDQRDILRFLIDTKREYDTNEFVTYATYCKLVCKRTSRWMDIPEQDVQASCDAFMQTWREVKLDVDFQTFKTRLLELLWHRILNDAFMNCIEVDGIGIQQLEWLPRVPTCYNSICPRYAYYFTETRTKTISEIAFLSSEGSTTFACREDLSALWSCEITLVELEHSYQALRSIFFDVLVSLCTSYLFFLPQNGYVNELSPNLIAATTVDGRKCDVLIMKRNLS